VEKVARLIEIEIIHVRNLTNGSIGKPMLILKRVLNKYDVIVLSGFNCFRIGPSGK
jgi:hypothetical protein